MALSAEEGNDFIVAFSIDKNNLSYSEISFCLIFFSNSSFLDYPPKLSPKDLATPLKNLDSP